VTAAPESASILVVDDDRVNRVLLVRSLETLGHRVVTAANGREALDRLQVEEPDIVLLDILMPVMDGMTVLEQIKGDPAVRDVLVIMISALEDLDIQVRELFYVSFGSRPRLRARARFPAGGHRPDGQVVRRGR
jgi:CheY-like chemotaxis protein